MITLTALKLFLNITGTASDDLLNDSIAHANAIAESATNQKLVYGEYTIIKKGDGDDSVYLPAKYVYQITGIKVYNRNGTYEWDDIFDSGYGLYDAEGITGIVLEEETGLVCSNYKLTIKHDYVFTDGAKIKITFTGGYVSADEWVTGTAFLEDDYTRFNNRTYKCLEDHTAGTFATDLAAGKWILATEVLAPGDLLQAVTYEAAMDYLNAFGSKQGRLGIGSENTVGHSSEGITYKEVDTKKIFQKHRVINI